MGEDARWPVACGVTKIAALLVVGAVSHGVLRYIVQTSPLWIGIVPAARRSGDGKWAALPRFIFWLLVMVGSWPFLLGWARIVSGIFSPTEIDMTLMVGAASFLGVLRALRLPNRVRLPAAAFTFLAVAALQLAMLRLSLIESMAHR